MQFDQELDLPQAEPQPIQPVLDEQDKIAINGGNFRLKFDTLVKFLNRFSNMRGVKKTNYAKQFIKLLFKHNRTPQFTYPIMRLLLPSDDKDRGNYGIKQKNLSKVIADSLSLTKEDYLRLHHYKNPSFHKNGVGIGDFSLCTYDVVKSYCKEKSLLSVEELNSMLDQLATSNKNHIKVFRKLFTISNAEEIKWIVRIILKDLKISLKIDTVLNTFHKDAADFFNLTNSLFETCKKFENPNVSLNDEVKMFFPIRPMLAGKKKIVFFKDIQTKTYYVQTKFDGERLQAHKRNSQIKLFSRNGVDYTKLYQIFTQIINSHVQAQQCILDGQIIVIQKDGHKMAPFGMNKMVALNKQTDQFQLCYKVFDILWLKEEDEQINLMKYNLKQRKEILGKIIREEPGVIERVTHQEMFDYDQILKRFSQSIDRNEEGIMLKDPTSIYVPKERAANWIKLKGDYVEGLTDTLDLIILGGYYGDSSARHGTSRHWTDQITSFLIGVIDRIDPLNSKIAYAIPFAKVGTGYSVEQLNYLRQRLRDNLVKNEGKNKLQYLQCNWKPSLQDRPDCWISNLTKSIILEVKAAEMTVSESYPTGYTLRFPRVVKIRYDKDWNEAQTMNDIKEMSNTALYSKHMKKRDDDSDSQNQHKRTREKDEYQQQDITTKKRKKQLKKDQILQDYVGFDMQNQKLVSHLFNGFQFCVFQLQNDKYTKIDIEREIMLNDGTVVQNPLPTTQYIITDAIDFKLRAFQTQKNSKYIFIKPNYVINCLKAQNILPLSPLYLTVLPSGNSKFYMDNFDRFGDSYISFLDQRELNQILDVMTGTYPINEALAQHIGLKYRRSGKISICFGVTELQRVKLKMHGNRIVQSFEDMPNSAIIKGEILPYQASRINEFVKEGNSLQVEYVEDLIYSRIL